MILKISTSFKCFTIIPRNWLRRPMKAWMFNWNESLSPLDGAVVEKRRGALACALTSIKIVISNQSAHWPTIQNITHGTAAGPRWVTRLKSFFTEPGEMQTKRPELHCRFYSRSVFSHLWLLRAYRCHVSSVVPSRHYPSFHMFPSRGKKRKEVGGGCSSCAGGWRKQASPHLVLGGGWTCVEARLSPNTSSLIPLFSPSFPSPRPSIYSSARGSFHIRYRRPPLSVFSPHRWGRSTPSQLGDSDFHATSPPSPQARGYKKPKPPITPRCGIGLKEPRNGATTNPVGTHNL